MPKRPPSPCAQPGCPALTHDRYCDKHHKQSHIEYRERRIDVEEQKFYGSAQWKKIRKQVLQRDIICTSCKREPSTMVDHIREIKDGGCKTCYDNLQGMCKACHNAKTAQERRKRR